MQPSHPAERLDAEMLRGWQLPLHRQADKYQRGTALVIGASAATPGAVVLCGEAALRIGAGRLQIGAPSSIAPAIGVAMPECAAMPIEQLASGELGAIADDRLRRALSDADAVVVGPGMVPGPAAAAIVEDVLRTMRADAVAVLDAAAIVAFRDVDAEVRERARGRLIMTPNMGEMDALISDATDDDEVVAAASTETGAVISSFGRVAAPDGRRWVVAGAPRGLGTSGSGDVLAGLAVGAAARCGDPAQAACWATFVHTASALRLDRTVGPIGYLAREIARQAPACLDEVC